MSIVNDNLGAQWKDGGNLVLGLWLAVSPWALSYAFEATPAWNAHIVGVVIAVTALQRWWHSRNGKNGSTPRSVLG